MITKIEYPCPNDILGDTSEKDCDLYRAWFADQLKIEYPGADITVTDTAGSIRVSTDDDGDDSELIDEIRLFGNHCWDKCPWPLI